MDLVLGWLPATPGSTWGGPKATPSAQGVARGQPRPLGIAARQPPAPGVAFELPLSLRGGPKATPGSIWGGLRRHLWLWLAGHPIFLFFLKKKIWWVLKNIKIRQIAADEKRKLCQKLHPCPKTKSARNSRIIITLKSKLHSNFIQVTRGFYLTWFRVWFFE
jgi:hypothetical protein